MKMIKLSSLVCKQNHCFDLSKRGYVNFLNRPLKTKYDKSLFESRRKIWKSGFFDGLIEEITKKISTEYIFKKKKLTVLDAGCGEGTFISSLQEKIMKQTTNEFLGIGMDICKEGIVLASKNYTNLIWCVADIANSPFEHKQFDFILNILSPSNYAEFKRILADDGMIIKVLPEKNYLQELRNIFYEHTNKKVYTNQKTIRHFKNHFKLLDVKRIQYHLTLSSPLIKSLIQMTPLSWGTTEKQLQRYPAMNTNNVTVDLTILLGKPH